MDFDIPEDLKLLRETVWRFVDRELVPLDRPSHMIAEGTPEIARMALARHIIEQFGS